MFHHPNAFSLFIPSAHYLPSFLPSSSQWRRSLRGLGNSLRGRSSSTTAHAALKVDSGLPASAPASDAGEEQSDVTAAVATGSDDAGASPRRSSPVVQRGAPSSADAQGGMPPPVAPRPPSVRLACPPTVPLAELRTESPSILRRKGVELTAKERHLNGERHAVFVAWTTSFSSFFLVFATQRPHPPSCVSRHPPSTDEDFVKAMACSRTDFYALPLWRQQQKKRLARIF